MRQQLCTVTMDPAFIEEIKNVLFTIMSSQHGKPRISKPIIKKEEFAFILTLFNLCNYGFHSYQLIAEDFQQLHQVFIDNTPEIKRTSCYL